jgi:hypothetical protein
MYFERENHPVSIVAALMYSFPIVCIMYNKRTPRCPFVPNTKNLRTLTEYSYTEEDVVITVVFVTYSRYLMQIDRKYSVGAGKNIIFCGGNGVFLHNNVKTVIFL